MSILGKRAQEPWARVRDLGSSTSPLHEAQGLRGAPLLGPVTRLSLRGEDADIPGVLGSL